MVSHKYNNLKYIISEQLLFHISIEEFWIFQKMLCVYIHAWLVFLINITLRVQLLVSML